MIPGTRGLTTQPDDRERLARAVSLEMQRLVQDHQAYLLGKQELRLGGWAPSKSLTPAAPLTFDAVIQGWLAG